MNAEQTLGGTTTSTNLIALQHENVQETSDSVNAETSWNLMPSACVFPGFPKSLSSPNLHLVTQEETSSVAAAGILHGFQTKFSSILQVTQLLFRMSSSKIYGVCHWGSRFSQKIWLFRRSSPCNAQANDLVLLVTVVWKHPTAGFTQPVRSYQWWLPVSFSSLGGFKVYN